MVNIIQGGKKQFTVRISSESTKDPLDLTTVAEITTCFKTSDSENPELMLSLTGGDIAVIGDPLLGKIQITLNDTDTAGLGLVDNETLELAIDLGAGPLKLQIPNAYSVIESVC